MSGNAFPTVGLEFDLTKIDAGQQRLKALREEYKGLGTDAEQAAQKVNQAGAQVATGMAATTEAAKASTKARAASEGELTLQIDAATRAQLAVRQRMWAQQATEAAQAAKVLLAQEASAAAQQVAAKAAAMARIQALANEGAAAAQMAAVRQGAAELVAMEATNAKKLEMQRAYMNAQMRLTAEGMIAQQRAEIDGAMAAAAAAKQRADAAARATAGISGGTAGFAVSGDAQGMAASIAATSAALKAQGDVTAYVAARDVELAAAQAEVTATQAAATAATVAATEAQAARFAALDGLSAGEKAFAKAVLSGQISLEALKKEFNNTTEAQLMFQNVSRGVAAAQLEQAAATGAAAEAGAAASKGGFLQVISSLLDVSKWSTAARAELVVLGRELANGQISRFAASFTRLVGLVGFINVLFNPLTLLAAAFVTLTVVVDRYAESQRRLNAEIAGVGAAMGVTYSQVEAAALAASRSQHISIGAGEEQVKAFLATGKIGGEVFSGLAEVTEAYAEATGAKAKDANKELAKAFADLAGGGAKELNDKLHFLTAAQLEHIEAMDRAGDHVKAQKETYEALQSWLDNTGTKVTWLTGLWKDGLAAVQDFIRGVAKALAGQGDPAAQTLATVRAQIEALKNAPKTEFNETRLKQLQAQADTLSKQVDGDIARAKAAAQNAAVNAGVDASSKLGLAGQQQLKDYQASLSVISKSIAAIKAEGAGAADAKFLPRLIADRDALTRATNDYNQAASQGVTIDALRDQRTATADEHMKAARKAKDQGAIDSAAREQALALATGKAVDATTLSAQVDLKVAATRAASTGASDRHNQSIERGIDALSASAAAALDAADAYLKSGVAAGNAAEARRKAVEKATREGMTEAQASRDIAAQENEALSRQIEGWSKSTAQLDAQTQARGLYNTLVAAGTMSVEQANDALTIENDLREKEEALLTASGPARLALIAQIEQERAARERGLAVQRDAKLLGDVEAQGRSLQVTATETALIVAENTERARRIAMMQKELELKAQYGDDFVKHSPLAQRDINGAGDLAQSQEVFRQKTAAHNEALNLQLTLLQALANQAGRTADAFGDAFGSMGAAIAGLGKVHADYDVENEAITRRETEALKAFAGLRADDADGQKARDAVLIRSTDERQANEQKKTLAEFDTFKSVFSQKSAAYKVIQGVEMAYYAQQFILRAASMAQDVVHTATTIAGSTARAAVLGVEAVVRAIASMPFPLNLAAGAATAAAVVSMGIALGGAFSGSNTHSAQTAADAQKAVGTGSVMGDAAAQSKSLSGALSNAEKYQDKSLDYAGQMVKALRAIQSAMGSVANAIAKMLSLPGSSLDTAGLGLGTTTGHLFSSIPLLGLFGSLFGTKTSNTLIDQGLNFGASTVGQIAAGGVNGQTYQSIEQQKSTSILGIKLAGSTRDYTTTGALDPNLARQIQLLIGSLKTGVVTAAAQLGVDGAQAAVDSFVVSIGKISLKGLSAEQISQELDAAFSKVADDMATSIAPVVAEFQKAGEGAFETLSRLATDYSTIDTTLASIGKSFGASGLGSLAGREDLLSSFDGLDNFNSAVSAYADKFLTDAEKLAPVQVAVSKAMTDMGYASVTTKDQFKALVSSLDLTKVSDQKLFASLLQIAPAFAQVADAAGQIVQALSATDLASVIDSLSSDAQKLATAQAAINTGFRSLGLAVPTSRDAFRTLMLGVDQTTDAGKTLAATLAGLAPAFLTVANAADAATAAAQAQASTNNNLLVTLFQAQGMSAEATALQRKLTLDGITDPTQRGLQQAIYTAQDKQTADQTRQTAQATALTTFNTALSNLGAAINKQVQTLQAAVDQMKGVAQSLRDARQQLEVSNDNLDPFSRLSAAQSQFETLRAASIGSGPAALAAKQGLAGAGQTYAQLAGQFAPDAVAYNFVLSQVKNALTAAADDADTQVSVLNAQLAELTAQGKTLGVISDGITDIGVAMNAYLGALGAASGLKVMDPQWGAVQNVAANKQLAADTGYAGTFGAGGFQAWIVDQPEWVKAKARDDLRAAGQADRIKFATGAAFHDGIYDRPTNFNIGQLGEGGQAEGILPLANVGGKLGVRSTNDNGGAVSAINALRDEVAQMRLEQEELGLLQARLLASQDTRGQKWDGDGLPATRTYG